MIFSQYFLKYICFRRLINNNVSIVNIYIHFIVIVISQEQNPSNQKKERPRKRNLLILSISGTESGEIF